MTSATATQLQQLYIAYFGRAADPSGLDYWLGQGTSSKAFAANMYLQPEFNEVNANKTIEQQIDKLYQNLFNRDADLEGKTYWAKQIRDGVLDLASFGNDLIWNVVNDYGSASDKAILLAKTDVVVAITDKVRNSSSAIKEYAGDSFSPFVAGYDIQRTIDFINLVDANNIPNESSIDALVNDIASVVDTLTVTSSTVSEGQSVTFTLATSTSQTSSGDLIPYSLSGTNITADDLVSGLYLVILL